VARWLPGQSGRWSLFFLSLSLSISISLSLSLFFVPSSFSLPSASCWFGLCYFTHVAGSLFMISRLFIRLAEIRRSSRLVEHSSVHPLLQSPDKNSAAWVVLERCTETIRVLTLSVCCFRASNPWLDAQRRIISHIPCGVPTGRCLSFHCLDSGRHFRSQQGNHELAHPLREPFSNPQFVRGSLG